VRLVAESFGWPFAGRRLSTWIGGSVAVLLLPVLFVPLLGYAIAATRAAEQDAAQGPPTWSLTPRLVTDGVWVAVAIALTVLPFALLWGPVSDVLGRGVEPLTARTTAALLLALPWGLLTLLHMPHATAAFAASGNPRDMLDLASAVQAVRRSFSSWNLVAAAIVTGWAAGLACAGLLCVGIVPGIFYAILVSAHAAATLQSARPGPSPSAR
jgi:Protein of unknown function (DUF4013)